MENFNVPYQRSEVIAGSAIYAVVGTIIVVINALTLWIFIRTNRLRTRKHVMVINLAVADLLFGALGLPFSIVYLLKPTIVFYYMYQAMNTFSKTASFFTLGVIAVERMHATIWPLRHQVMNNRVYKIALVGIWVLSAIMAAFMIFHRSGLLEMTLIYNAITPIVISLITFTIVTCYVSIWISFRRRKQRNLGSAAKRDKALAVTLSLVTGAFLVCWAIPMFYISISRLDICKNCYQPTDTFFKCVRFLFAAQSMINPVIYCFGLPAFKASLKVRVQDLKWSTLSENFGSRRNSQQRKISREIEMVDSTRKNVNERTL